MKIKKINLKKYKLRIRMTVSNILLSIIPLLVFSVITYGVFINDSQKLITSTLNSTFEQMTYRLDEYFGSVNTTIKTFALDESIQNILRNDPSFSLEKSREKVKLQLNNILMINSTISDGFVVTSPEDIIGTNDSIPHDVINELVEAARNNGSGNAFLAVNAETGINLIAAVRPVRNLENLKELGYVVMLVNKDRLLKIFETDIYGANMHFLIVDTSGNPVLLPDSNVQIPIRKIHNSIPEDATTYTDSIENNGVDYRFIVHKSNQTEWEMVAVVAEDELYSRSWNIGYNILLYIIAIVFIITILTTIANFRITKPITRLAEAIDRVASGDTKHKISFSDKNEITLIADNFNHMVDEVQAAKKRIFSTQQRLYETELQKKQFEVSLLQSQINSHFLYNTLSCIRAMSRKGAEKEVSDMITSLVGMLRYASNMQEKSVMQDEFNNIKNYVHIQRMRLGEQLQLIFCSEDDILDCEIPKMTLQPVVENSILHGFQSQDGIWTIRITARRKGETVEIRVLDNGKGIDNDRLSLLSQSLKDKKSIFDVDSNKSSIGLVNIQNRIHSLYGEEYGVNVRSWRNLGTAVVIKIPYKRSDDYVFGTFDR